MNLNIEGYKGSLDILLHLARNQKVDLTQISILELVDQYLIFIEESKVLQLDLVADYLVMASWLTYLKSRLLLPESDDDELPAQELTERLMRQLKRLDMIQKLAKKLMQRKQLGSDFFARGMPEGIQITKHHRYDISLYDLLCAYSTKKMKKVSSMVLQPINRDILTISQARIWLGEMLGMMQYWDSFENFLIKNTKKNQNEKSVVVSSFVVILEFIREGKIEVQQQSNFGELLIRCKPKN